MQKNFYSISIGVPVYNEENNIQNLLYSLAMQQEVRIEQTIVVNDGSTDKTLYKILEINKKTKRKINLELINLDTNKGKSNALNLIFKRARSEYLVLIDSDIMFVNEYALKYLLNPFEKDGNIGLVCGWYFVTTKGLLDLTGRAYRFSSKLLGNINPILNNILGATGAIMAISKDIYKNIDIPIDVIRDDAYIYLFTISQNKKFVFNQKVKVIIQSPHDNIRQFLLKQIRGNSIPKSFIEIFGKPVMREFQPPPFSILFPFFVKTFIYSPIDGLSWCILKSISSIYKKFKTLELSHKWRSLYEKG